jgi:hypothetical protein
MTDDQVIEAFELVRAHSSPLVLPVLLAMQRAWDLDREVSVLHDRRATLTEALYGHRVYEDNDRHSRRATGLRSVS